MILDQQLLLADGQTLVGTNGTTVVSTNTIDTGARITSTDGTANSPAVWPNLNNGNVVTIASDLGKSEIELLIQVTTAVTGASSTLQFQVITSASANLGSPTVLCSSAAIGQSTMVAGYQFRLSFPIGQTQRYVGVQYVIGGADTTGGAYSAALLLDKNTQSI